MGGPAKHQLLEQVHGLGIDAEHLGQAYHLNSELSLTQEIFTTWFFCNSLTLFIIFFRSIAYSSISNDY